MPLDPELAKFVLRSIDTDRLLKPKAAASLLSMGLTKLSQVRKSGHLRAVSIDRGVYYRLSDLQAYIAQL